MNKVLLTFAVFSMPWLGGCATMFSEGKWGYYPLEIKAEQQQVFFHVGGLGRNDSIQITGKAPRKLYLPSSGFKLEPAPLASYRVSCTTVDGVEKKAYLIRERSNVYFWLNALTAPIGLIGMIIDLASGHAFELEPDEVVC